jgi:hypothetical protein
MYEVVEVQKEKDREKEREKAGLIRRWIWVGGDWRGAGFAITHIYTRTMELNGKRREKVLFVGIIIQLLSWMVLFMFMFMFILLHTSSRPTILSHLSLSLPDSFQVPSPFHPSILPSFLPSFASAETNRYVDPDTDTDKR